jgi:hypothetical protein
MKRLLLGLFTTLVLAMASSVLPANAAANAPLHGPGRGVGGQVTAIDGTTITVKTPQGAATIATTASTTFEIDRKTGSLSDITVGLFVHAEGAKGTDGVLTATRVIASSTAPKGGKPPTGGPKGGVGGQVTAIDGTTITVKTPQGTATIATTASTTFEVDRKTGSLSDITVGLFVHAEGAKGTDGVLTATRAIASSTRPERPARH